MRMSLKTLVAITLIALLLSGCMTTQYALVDSGSSQVGALQVSAVDEGWNLVPGILTQHLPPKSSIWTRDGVLLDQLMLLGPIAHEQTLFVSKTPDTLVFPTFRQEMLPNEIEELVQATLTRQIGSNAVVATSNLRPRRLANQRAVAFDVLTQFSDGATQKGYVTAAIVDEALYVLIYQAAQLHYFDKHWDAASAVIDSARLEGS